jgi:hypothetical protein
VLVDRGIRRTRTDQRISETVIPILIIVLVEGND